MTGLRNRFLSWRIKLPLMIIAVVSGVALVIGVVITLHDRMRFREALEERALLLAETVAATAPEAMLRSDHWALYQTLKQVASRVHVGQWESPVLTAMVLDAEGHILAHLDPKGHPLGLRLAPREALERDLLTAALKMRTPSVLGSHAATGFVEGVVPVLADGKFLGVVRLRLSTGELDAQTLDAAVTVLALTLGLAALGSLLGVLISRRMVRPLEALAQGMEAVRRGDPGGAAPVAAHDQDEIGRLAGTFNRMAAELAEKRELEKQLAMSERLASLGRMAAGVAHEVNNPLGGMLNCIGTLKKRPDDARLLRRYLPLLESGLNRIAATVRGLLIEARSPDEAVPCDLHCLDELRELVDSEIGESRVALRWDNRLDGDTQVVCHCPHVQQIVLNLVRNGLQAIEADGAVAVRTFPDRDSLVLEVEDDGAGIPREDLTHLYDPFFTGRPAGTGLGLWITYRLVERMGGNIKVESEPGHGTRFRVVLPLANPAMAEAAS